MRWHCTRHSFSPQRPVPLTSALVLARAPAPMPAQPGLMPGAEPRLFAGLLSRASEPMVDVGLIAPTPTPAPAAAAAIAVPAAAGPPPKPKAALQALAQLVQQQLKARGGGMALATVAGAPDVQAALVALVQAEGAPPGEAAARFVKAVDAMPFVVREGLMLRLR